MLVQVSSIAVSTKHARKSKTMLAQNGAFSQYHPMAGSVIKAEKYFQTVYLADLALAVWR